MLCPSARTLKVGFLFAMEERTALLAFLELCWLCASLHHRLNLWLGEAL